MVVNQAHLGCDKSVILSLDSSHAESHSPGFEKLSVQIERVLWDGNYLAPHPWKSLLAVDQHVLGIKMSMIVII